MLTPYVLPTVTYSAGSKSIINLRDLPKTINGKHAHAVKMTCEVVCTPTYASGSVTTVGEHEMFRLELQDGNGVNRFQGSLNSLRAKERLQTGRIRLADPDLGATTVARYFCRVFHFGPPQMKNFPSDFALATGLLENGQLIVNHAALATISADVSAVTGQLRVTVWMALLDELRVAPAYQWGEQNTSSADVTLTGKAAYECIALLNSASYDAITPGDFSNIRVDMGRGDLVPTVPAQSLRWGFQDSYAAGEMGAVVGEPEAAADDNPKVVNRASPTAVAAADFDLQPILWAEPNEKLSKLPVADSVCKVRWSGSQTSGVLLYGRFLEQTPNVVTSLIAKAAKAHGVTPKGADVKTASKKKFVGPPSALPFMPWKVAL